MKSSELTTAYTSGYSYAYAYIHTHMHHLYPLYFRLPTSGTSDIPVIFGASDFRVPTTEISNLTSAHP
ncbi:hypothetical protein Y032_0055g2622 [Ancylostoma ceylanicum]|uniref:Uncharacterized protein n=1 Tax=Ancylostoma ceylanicum TaxID=53326 RepID=A0A016U601_9BILA|nr:hypothetical protein Y032_0055g2622 [Ancylostoma ceylanicum]